MSAADTGNGATLTLATTGAVGNIRNIGEVAEELGKLETSHLGTTGFKTYMPDDLTDPGEFEIEVEVDTEVAKPACGVVETATITYPLRTGEATAANHAGTGFIRRVTLTPLANSTIQIMKLLFAFDGETGPAFTPAA